LSRLRLMIIVVSSVIVLYEIDLVEQFVSESLADRTYSSCLLLFLRQQYAVDYRKVIWAELQDDFQAIHYNAPLDLQGTHPS
jgi:hypothetical protein